MKPEQEFVACKYGYNWKYIFEEKRKGEERQVVISVEVIYKTASGLRYDKVFQYDTGRREDGAVDAIRDCFADFYALAAENEVETKDIGSETMVKAGLDSDVVKSLIADLKKIGRVLIEELSLKGVPVKISMT